MFKKDKQLDLLNVYGWVAVNKYGVAIKGDTRAESIEIARNKIEAKGLTISSIKQKRGIFLSRKEQGKIKQQDINLFFRQLSTMLSAGIPLVQSLEVLANGVESLKMASLLIILHKRVSGGNTLASALEKFPKYFNELICSLVRVGETSGTLDGILERLASYLERIASLKARVKKALYYPVIVFVVMIALAVLLLTFIVPRFQGMFESFGKDLPGPTQVIISLSNGLQNYWWLILLILAIIIGAHLLFKKQSEGYKDFLAKASLKIPIFGKLIQKAIIARVVRTLSVTLNAGVPLSDALLNAAKVANNRVFFKALTTVRERIVIGDKIADAMRDTGLFSPMVIQMVSIGEHSGSLELMLTKIAEFYDEQVDNAVEGLTSLIEPIMILLLGIIVGGFVISMYLPIFKIGTLV